MVEPVCRRCGRCCHFEIAGVTRKCRFLVVLESGRTICRIYRQREGIEIYPGIFCIKRSQDPRIFPGCPYNKQPL